ncbi:PTS transporter subunit EIIC [Brenneria izadpanahii]|uniref:PTS transporter subunit EIIC n=1 Tax=Brenneria izadpanahii TaxID=2722756 RepID=A0ABX7UVG9_9GAMM|nr:PTS transporter subunit EIIC [Brenneria izadpanahii]QTF09728.1 PTS transporter subunit EIIC [Brenneria izadpanahii]
MDYKQVARQLVPLMGGKDNIASAIHCATRLRVVLEDESKLDLNAIDAVKGVKASFRKAGQVQVVFDSSVINDIYDAFVHAAMIDDSTQKEEASQNAVKNLSYFQRIASTLSNVFIPIIPAIIASGLLMGLMSLIRTYGWLDSKNAVYVLLEMFSSSAFIILPVLIGFTAARVFGGNPFLGATIGGILTHPTLANVWGGLGSYHTLDFYGLQIAMIGYQGTVFPVLLTVWFMCFIEKRLRRIVPDIVEIIFVPFLTLIVSGFVALLVIGPAGRMLGDGIAYVLTTLIAQTGWIAGVIFGGLYSVVAMTGIQNSFHAIEAGLLINPNIGVNYLLPIWSMSNVAQGGACLAVWFRTRDSKVRKIAIPAAFSAMIGSVEAAVFGVNLRFVKPFVAAMGGGAVGGAWVVYNKVYATGVGLTGLPGLAIIQASSLVNHLIGLTMAFGLAFFISLLFNYNQKGDQ